MTRFFICHCYPLTTALLVWTAIQTSFAAAEEQLVAVGVAQIDITPSYSIRLSGYGNRKTESDGVEQCLWAKAVAMGADDSDAVILITVDNCGVPSSVTEEVSKRLTKRTGIQRKQLAICSSHTHCAPMLTGVLPLIFGAPIAADQQQRIDRYTRELTDQLEQVAWQAWADRQPRKLEWAVGKISFAINRRSQKTGGLEPVDHSLPVLRVVDKDGNLRAILARYTCHAVTLFSYFNRICGDWPGYAQEAIQRNYPGCIAMVAIGCAGDQKPNLQSTVQYARQHGEAIANEVERLLRVNRFSVINGPDLIADTVQRLVPVEIYSKQTQLEFPPPKESEASPQCFQTNVGSLLQQTYCAYNVPT